MSIYRSWNDWSLRLP